LTSLFFLPSVHQLLARLMSQRAAVVLIIKSRCLCWHCIRDMASIRTL